MDAATSGPRIVGAFKGGLLTRLKWNEKVLFSLAKLFICTRFFIPLFIIAGLVILLAFVFPVSVFFLCLQFFHPQLFCLLNF